MLKTIRILVENWNDLLTIWGAIVATLLLFLELVRYYGDRPKLSVKVKGDWVIGDSMGLSDDTSYVVITAVNVRKRPITITKAGLLKPRKGYLTRFTESGNPFELSEGKSYDFPIKESDLQRHGLNGSNYVEVVEDSTGRRFYSHGVFSRIIKLQRIR
jgi:hypothetical protein